MNDIASAEAYRLSFYFDIPLELCQNEWEDGVDLRCTPDVDYDSQFEYLWVAILSNQKRFVSDNYEGNQIIKETSVEWLPLPRN